MPWKECSVMDERLRFVARVLDGEAMSDVCRSFGISRKTGYKIFNRYKEHGLEALSDRSRRPVRYANQLPQQIESLIVSLKQDKPHWGAPGCTDRPLCRCGRPRSRNKRSKALEARSSRVAAPDAAIENYPSSAVQVVDCQHPRS
jgi:transposase-like protein